MDTWKIFLNRFVKVVYEDGDNHYSVKKGKLIEVNDTHLILQLNNSTINNTDITTHEAINLSKILRVEENNNDN